MSSGSEPQPLGPTPEQIAALVRSFHFARVGSYFQVACTGIMLWDHVTTFDLEVELIWKKRFSLIQVLYFVNRYGGTILFLHGTAVQNWLSGVDYERTCESSVYVQTWISMITLYSMQGIIINRLWCMYNRSKVILFTLIIAISVELLSSLIMMGLQPRLQTFVIHATPTWKLCISLGFAPWFWSFWVFIAAFDFLIFALAFWQGIRYFQETRILSRHRRTRSQQSILETLSLPWRTRGNLLHILLRDSITFPFIGFVVCTVNLLGWFNVFPIEVLQITISMSALSSSVIGPRLILNLRDAYYRPFSEEFHPTLKDGPADGSAARFPLRHSTTPEHETVVFADPGTERTENSFELGRIP
ncbi:hypothetical protein FA15DRAFT_663953 [Coprinopsis marcescibilis]|uniref:DUF6533 domain-containing protein n=1 Tax=Coprinopsis marcescibilis TaxID=230819 RepID=A0A5C3L9Q7_COPMA|nr:hypothetical protein FA15DRAFT_663953 [Coprinopsis marcescibilis]